MILEKFLQDFNYAPYLDMEVAGLASTVTDNKGLSDTAKAFIEASEKFNSALEDVGYEFG